MAAIFFPVQRLTKALSEKGYRVERIHSGVPQWKVCDGEIMIGRFCKDGIYVTYHQVLENQNAERAREIAKHYAKTS